MKNDNKIKKIILTRTVPLALFLEILKHIEKEYLNNDIILILQEGIIHDCREFEKYKHLVIPDGNFKVNKNNNFLINEIRKEKPDLFIISSNNSSFTGYEEFIKLGYLCDIRNITLISKDFISKEISGINALKTAILLTFKTYIDKIYEILIFIVSLIVFSLVSFFIEKKRTTSGIEINNRKSGRIAIFVHEYPFEVSSPIIHLIEYLLEKKFFIDLILCHTYSNLKAGFNSTDIAVHDFTETDKKFVKVLDKKKFLRRLAVYTEKKVSGSSFINILVNLKCYRFYSTYSSRIKYLSQEIYHELKNNNYDFFIGFNRGGLNCAFLTADYFKFPVKIVYFNLELSYFNEFYRLVETFYEIRNSKKSFLIIIQDQERWDFLKNKNRLNGVPYLFIPSGTRGEEVKKCEYIYEKFPVKHKSKIVIYTGSIADWTLIKELVKCTVNWPDEWILFVHGFRGGTFQYMEELKEMISKYYTQKVFLSLNFLTNDDFNKLLASADIAAGFYKDGDINNKAVGSAACKFSKYFRCGLPVIANNYPSIMELLNEYNCGLGTNDFSLIGSLITEIDKNYQFFRENAFRCYRKKFDLDNYYPQLLEKIYS